MNVFQPKPAAKSVAPSLRTGSEYLRSLRDGRRVFVDGELVKDVTEHPAFRQAARSLAAPFRYRCRSGHAGADDFRLAEDRSAGAPRLSDPQDPRRPQSAPPVFGSLGGSDIRPHGTDARPCRRLLLRLRRGARRVRRRWAEICRQPRSRSSSTCATTIFTRATRSFRRKSTAASRRTNRVIRRSMRASSRNATTASSSAARSSSPPPAFIRITSISAASIRCSRATRLMRTAS